MRLETPSRAVRDAVARLRRVAAEHRAAARALRALALAEVARGNGELEAIPLHDEGSDAGPEPCPRCLSTMGDQGPPQTPLIRDAESAASEDGGNPPRPRKTRRARGESGQQALPFKTS